MLENFLSFLITSAPFSLSVDCSFHFFHTYLVGKWPKQPWNIATRMPGICVLIIGSDFLLGPSALMGSERGHALLMICTNHQWLEVGKLTAMDPGWEALLTGGQRVDNTCGSERVSLHQPPAMVPSGASATFYPGG